MRLSRQEAEAQFERSLDALLLAAREPVFVYGTLKLGYGNNRILQEGGAEFIGDAITTGQQFRLYAPTGIGFPFLKDVGAGYGTDIKGEVWLVPQRTLARLDQLEGVPHFYRRDRKYEIQFVENNVCFEAWVYIWPGSIAGLEEIGSEWNSPVRRTRERFLPSLQSRMEALDEIDDPEMLP